MQSSLLADEETHLKQGDSGEAVFERRLTQWCSEALRSAQLYQGGAVGCQAMEGDVEGR
jgi:hypothetical protein